MRSDSMKKAQQKYAKEKTVMLGIRLNRNTDKDIIKWIDSEDNRQGAVKRAIRYYLNNRRE